MDRSSRSISGGVGHGFFRIRVGFGRESENRERLENRIIKVALLGEGIVVWGEDQRAIERVFSVIG